MEAKGSHQILESGGLRDTEEGSEMYDFSTGMLIIIKLELKS